MTDSATDPYQVLGIPEGVSDAQLRSVYRRLVQLHHPDHNGGSAESARRFEAIQDAYARAVALRRVAGDGERSKSASALRGTPYGEHAVSARVAAMEREIRERALAEQRAREQEAAARAAVQEPPRKPTPEELGYVTTDDSLGQIVEDARGALSRRWSRSRGSSFADRLADLFTDGE
jgi:curved DNA-binding protein CbpA